MEQGDESMLVEALTLLEIPDELILSIAGYMPRKSLLALRATHSKLKTCLDSKRNVYFNNNIFQQITLGIRHTLALTEAGTLYAWGYNAYGQLGIGNRDCQLAPVKIKRFDASPVKQIALGGCHTLLLTEAGELYSWGNNRHGKLGIGNTDDQLLPVKIDTFYATPIKQIAVGVAHTLVLTEAGTLFAWGDNDYGQLGIGNTDLQLAPVQINRFDASPIKQIALGGCHTLVLTEAGTLFAWGMNAYGQLGIGNRNCQFLPVKIDIFDAIPIKQIAVGDAYTFVLTEAGELYGWGRNAQGQLGIRNTDDQLLPVKIDTFDATPIKQIAVGDCHAFALTEDGRVFAWGYNAFGQLGIGNTDRQLAPVQINGFDASSIKQIALGGRHTLVLTKAGTLFPWGYNRYGQLGIGNSCHQLAHVKINRFDASPIKQIALGDDYTLALTEAGTVYAWGKNESGQLGIGNRDAQLEPVEIPLFRALNHITQYGISRAYALFGPPSASAVEEGGASSSRPVAPL